MFKGKTMVTFNELRITPDGNTLIIDVAIKDLRYYDNVGLDTILIDTQDTFTAEGPSSKAVKFPVINSIDSESFEQEFGDTYDFKGTLKEGFLYTFKVPNPTGEYTLQIDAHGNPHYYSLGTISTRHQKNGETTLDPLTTSRKKDPNFLYKMEVKKEQLNFE